MSKTIKNTAEVFKALSDENRLKIIKIISSTGNNLCVAMIAQELGISQPAVSQHLKILKNVGLIEAERQGVYFHYKIVENAMAPFGMSTTNFLASFGAEFNFDTCCQHKDNEQKCKEVND